MHVGIAYLRWRGKRSRHSRRMRTRNFAYLARGPWETMCIMCGMYCTRAITHSLLWYVAFINKMDVRKNTLWSEVALLPRFCLRMKHELSWSRHKWLPFCRQYLLIHIYYWKILYFDFNFNEVGFEDLNHYRSLLLIIAWNNLLGSDHRPLLKPNMI